MKLIAIVLLCVGALALVYGGFTYSKDRTVLEMGSMSITAKEEKSFPVPAVVGVAVLLSGGALLLVGSRRRVRVSA